MVTEKNGNVWLSPKEAATYLGLSVDRIYHLKEKLTHRKSGDTPQARIYFLESALFEDYMNL